MMGKAKTGAAAAVAALILISGPAAADAFRGAVGAGLLGAGIGGIAGGGSGAAKGAAIGAGVGILAGSSRENQRQQQQQQQQMEQQRLQQQEAEAARLRAEQERLALERQRLEMEQQMHRERMMMQQQQQQFAAPAPAVTPIQPVDSALIADIQRSLTILGFQPGPIDGLLGAQTVVAIKNYETQNGLLVTGQPSHPLLQHMRARGG